MNKYTDAVVISAGTTGLSAVQALLFVMQHSLSIRMRLLRKCCISDNRVLTADNPVDPALITTAYVYLFIYQFLKFRLIHSKILFAEHYLNEFSE